MKKTMIGQAVMVLSMFVAVTMYAAFAQAEEKENYVFAAQSNNIWILEKSSRRIVLVGYEKPDNPWKTEIVAVPAGFNLDNCRLTAVGIRGTAAFLQDASSGKLAFFHAKDDGSVTCYDDFSATKAFQEASE